MNSRLRILATVFILLITASSLAGCSVEPGERTQLVGQECFLDGDCVEGALCVERLCRYETSARINDAGRDSTDDPADVPPGDANDPDVGFLDVAVGEDGGQQLCRPTARRCISDTELEYCRDDGTGFDTRTCQDGLRCERGECVPVDLSTCEFQDQPCDQEGLNNGFYCTAMGGDEDQMRCLGICDTTGDDPDSTCPEPGSVCTFSDDQGGGVCLSGCTLGQGCDLSGYGCLPLDGHQSEGACVPANPDNEIGERCDDDSFFDCEEGAVCLDLQNGGRCVEACRAFTGGPGTDCDDGHCMPLTDSLGMCRPDAGNRTEGDQCRQQQFYRTCNEDAVLCAPSGGQSAQCSRLCRLQEGDSDCNGQQRCFQYDQDRDDLGICIDNAP
jgi:hypothetical protein